ncbi:MAG: hypothetical protein IPI43_11700 [Sandaracinaceae bacterium]|nr:hypothetical protein [Sandaracinaceae bacterium]
MARPPIHVRSLCELRLTPAQVGEAVLTLENWPDFRGYGPLPGIREARFRRRTDAVVDANRRDQPRRVQPRGGDHGVARHGAAS